MDRCMHASCKKAMHLNMFCLFKVLELLLHELCQQGPQQGPLVPATPARKLAVSKAGLKLCCNLATAAVCGSCQHVDKARLHCNSPRCYCCSTCISAWIRFKGGDDDAAVGGRPGCGTSRGACRQPGRWCIMLGKISKDWQGAVMRFITSGKRVDFTVGWWPLQLCSRGWLCHQGALWEPDHYLMTPVQAVSASTPRSLSVSCCSAAGSLHIDKADAQAAG
jgi:hypothetical protein